MKLKSEKEIDAALSQIRKELIAAIGSESTVFNAVFQEVTVGSDVPTNTEGTEGDIYLQHVDSGTAVYQKISVDAWELKGTIASLNLYYPTQF